MHSDSTDLPFRESIRCDLAGCGCRYGSLIWVSHARQAIYFEIPKTGCSSIKNALGIDPRLHKPVPPAVKFRETAASRRLAEQHFGPVRAAHWITALRGEIYEAFSDRSTSDLGQILSETIAGLCDELQGNSAAMAGRWRPHAQSPYGFAMHYGSARQAAQLYPDYFKFAVIWEPEKRLASSWRMFCRMGIPFRRQQIDRLFGEATGDYSFEQFVDKALVRRNHHWGACTRFLPEGEHCGKLLDRLIRLPDLNGAWPKLSRRLGLGETLPHVNKSKGATGDPPLDPAARNRVHEAYAADIRLYRSTKV